MDGKGRSTIRIQLVFMLFVISAIAFLDRTNISVAGVQMRQEYGIDKIRLGWVFSAFLIGYAAFQVPAGWLAARFGPRKLLTAALIWWSLFSIATALVPPDGQHAILMLAIVRFALGIGEAAVYPAGNQFVSRWVPAQERGKANGLIFAGVGAGSGLTPPLITAIIAGSGWRASFYVCAVIGVIAAILWYVVARDRPQDHQSVGAAELAYIEAGLPPAPEGNVAIPWRAIYASRNVWGLFLSYFAFGYVVWIFFSWFFIYLAEARGLDLKSSALFGMAPFLAMTAGCLIGGVLNDSISRRFGLYWGRSGLAMASFVLTGVFLLIGSRHRRHCRTTHRRRFGPDERGMPAGWCAHFVADAVDRGAIWLGRCVRHRRDDRDRRHRRLGSGRSAAPDRNGSAARAQHHCRTSRTVIGERPATSRKVVPIAVRRSRTIDPTGGGAAVLVAVSNARPSSNVRRNSP
jgi:ACS family glucarate transporter-like MFS transporter